MPWTVHWRDSFVERSSGSTSPALAERYLGSRFLKSKHISCGLLEKALKPETRDGLGGRGGGEGEDERASL